MGQASKHSERADPEVLRFLDNDRLYRVRSSIEGCLDREIIRSKLKVSSMEAKVVSIEE